MRLQLLNQFQVNDQFPKPLKTSENQSLLEVFREYTKETWPWNELKKQILYIVLALFSIIDIKNCWLIYLFIYLFISC